MAEKTSAKADFLKAAAKHKAAFKKARKVDATGFDNPELADGRYKARLESIRCGVTKTDKTPYVSINFKIVSGESKGERPSIFHTLKDEQSIEYLVKSCKRLDIDCDDMELEEMIDALDALAEDHPEVFIDAKNNTYKNKKTKKTENALNIYVGKLATDSDEEESDDDEEADDAGEDEEEGTDDGEEDSDDADEDDSEESEDADEDDEDGEDEPADPAKGDVVKYKPKGARKPKEFTVTKVNTKAKTVDLKDEDGETHKAVPFDSVEIVFDEEDE